MITDEDWGLPEPMRAQTEADIAEKAIWDRGYDCGLEAGMDYTGQIVQDLIVELRATQQRLRDTGARHPMELVYGYDKELNAIAHRAEARLREVGK
jgi:hypothetical protein